MQTLSTPFIPSTPLNLPRARAAPDAAGALALRAVALSILLPDEIGFSLAGLRFSVTRVILLLLTPVLAVRFARMLAAGCYRFIFSDLLVLLTGVWMIAALTTVDGLQEALNHAGPIALEFCIGYMAARFLLSERGDAVSFIKFLCWAIAIVALLGLPDTLTHRWFVHELVGTWFGDATGSLSWIEDATGSLSRAMITGENGDRLGLLRATSTLEHPILFGITCGVGLLLAASIRIKGGTLVVLTCGLGTFLALSSAPLQAVLMGFGLLTYDRILAGIRYRWISLISLAAAGIIALFGLFNDPVGIVCSHFVFDAGSAWYRIREWSTASAALAQSPWFGLGWEISPSFGIPWTIDSIWLLWALKFGIPGALLLALAIIGAASRPTNGPGVCLTRAESKLGTTLGILIFLVIFLGFTVDFFGSAWILIPVLAGVRAHLGELGRLGHEARTRSRLGYG